MAKRDAGAGVTGSAAHVCLGAIAGAHGVRGEVRVLVFTAAPEAIGDYGDVATEDGAHSFRLTVVRRLPRGMVLARLAGVDDRDAAEALKGVRLYVPRDRLPPPPEDEFYHADLIGLAARTAEGIDLGTVTAVHNFGGGDVLEISPTRGASVMLPFTPEVVPEVDIDGGTVTVEPPPGMLE